MSKVRNDESPTQSGATDLYERLSEQSEDVLDEVCAETWPGGEDEWWAQDGGPLSAFEEHREATFRLVMGELAVICLERSLGRYGGQPAETGASS